MISYSMSNCRMFEILYDHIGPPTLMLTIVSRMVNNLEARSPISFQHMSFWCLFLD